MTVTYLLPLGVWRHRCSSTPMTSTPSKRWGSLSRVRSARSTMGVISRVQEIPRTVATPDTDPSSTPRARIPQSTADHVSLERLAARRPASCLHTPRHDPHAKRRTPATSSVGRHPTGRWARLRTTVPTPTP